MHARRAGIVKKVCFEKELRDTNVCGGKELLPFQSQIKWNRRNIANYIVNLKIKEQTKTCSWPSITVNTIKLRANGCSNSQQCLDLDCCATLRRSRNKRNYGSWWLKSLTGFKLCATTRNNMQQHATTCNRVCKRMQHVTSNNIGSCWPTMLRPSFARDFS